MMVVGFVRLDTSSPFQKNTGAELGGGLPVPICLLKSSNIASMINPATTAGEI